MVKKQGAAPLLDSIKELISLWEEFHSHYKAAFGQENPSEEAEEKFLKVKSEIARRSEAILCATWSESFYEEKMLMQVVLQIPTLKSIAAISEMQLRKIESDWHSAYISLNRLLGRMESQGGKKQKDLGKKISSQRRAILKPLVVLIVIIAVILFLAFLLLPPKEVETGGINYQENILMPG